MVNLAGLLSMVGGASVVVTFSLSILFRRLYAKYWNIPCIILKFTGDKRRPTVSVTRARREYTLGRNRLWVKGYRLPIRDFSSENYYPSAGSKDGGLILWEFRKGWLTPTKPVLKELSPEKKTQFLKLLSALKGVAPASFEFNPDLYKNLVVKAIDDIDVEWFLRQQDRIEQQYSGGWREFLQKYGAHMVLAFIGLMMLVGFIVWMKDAPSQAGACIQAGVEAAKNTYLSDIAGQAGLVPPG